MILYTRKAPPVTFARLSLAGVLAFLLSAPMLLPTAHYMSNSQRPELDTSSLTTVHQEFVATCWSNTLFPESYGNGNDFAIQRLFSGGNFIHAELVFYFGIVTLVLALLALSSPGLGRWMVVLAFCVLLVPATPIYRWFEVLPGLNRINATRSIQIIHFLMAFSAGYGAQLLSQRRGRRIGSVLCGVLTVIGLGWAVRACSQSTGPVLNELFEQKAVRLPPRDLFLSDQSYFQATIEGFEQVYSWTNPFIWIPLLCLIGSSVVLASRREPAKFLLLLLVVDLFTLGRSLNSHHPKDRLFPINESISQLRQAGLDRVMGVGTVKPNTLAPVGVMDVAGYDGFYPKNSGQYLGYLMYGAESENRYLPAQVFPIKNYRSPLVDLMGVKLLVAYPGQNLEGKTLLHPTPIPIFSNPQKLDRVFLVQHTVVQEDNLKALALLDRGEVDPRQTAILTEELPQPLEPAEEAGTVSIKSYETNEVLVWAQVRSRSLLVFSDAHAEGWEVEIDGRAAEMHRVDVMFRGVVIPPGEHLVRFVFRPRNFRVGLFLALFGILGAAVLLVRLRHEKPATGIEEG